MWAFNGKHWPHEETGIHTFTTGISIVSTPASENTYRRGEHIDIALDFNRPVTVRNFVPELNLALGDDPAYLIGKVAAYHHGSETARLIFRYTVSDNIVDTTGLQLSDIPLRAGQFNHQIKTVDFRDHNVAAFVTHTLRNWQALTPRQHVDGRNRAPVFCH